MIIAFPHAPPHSGGPASFQKRLEKKLMLDGHEIVYSKTKEKFDIIIVIGGTRKIFWLFKNKIKGVPILLRLGGINWIHRYQFSGFIYSLKAELSNILTHSIKVLSNHVIYQSTYVKELWKNKYFHDEENCSIIYNSVDLKSFSRQKVNFNQRKSIIFVEGNIDYSPFAVTVINFIAEKYYKSFSISVFGSFEKKSNLEKLSKRVNYYGRIDQDRINKVFENCIYIALDINPACPNTVIEALASGIPVVGFKSGAMEELVPKECGRLIALNGVGLKVLPQDLERLAENIDVIFQNWEAFSQSARFFSEKKFDVNYMYSEYLKAIHSVMKKI